ncbi:hypothetical protein [Mycolicibacter arupensis]
MTTISALWVRAAGARHAAAAQAAVRHAAVAVSASVHRGSP